MLMMKNSISILFLLLIFTPLVAPQLVWAGESDTYNFSWLDPDKEVFVLQNRRFRKTNRVHIYAGVGKNMSAPFVNSQTIFGRAGYFLSEDYGLELVYGKSNGKENDTAAQLRNKGGSGSIPFRRIVDTFYGGMFLWSPFYSKINTFNTIVYYDWIFGGGMGKIKESNNTDNFIQGTAGVFADRVEEHNAFLWNIGIKIYLTTHISARIDVLAIHYKATPPVSGSTEELWNDNFDLGITLGYNF
jgi:outer membrane beta-barrel protein